MQSGDPACRAVWNLLCDISRREFQRVYDALGVTLTEVGESFYNPMIAPTLDILTEVMCSLVYVFGRVTCYDVPMGL